MASTLDMNYSNTVDLSEMKMDKQSNITTCKDQMKIADRQTVVPRVSFESAV